MLLVLILLSLLGCGKHHYKQPIDKIGSGNESATSSQANKDGESDSDDGEGIIAQLENALETDPHLTKELLSRLADKSDDAFAAINMAITTNEQDLVLDVIKMLISIPSIFANVHKIDLETEYKNKIFIILDDILLEALHDPKSDISINIVDFLHKRMNHSPMPYKLAANNKYICLLSKVMENFEDINALSTEGRSVLSIAVENENVEGIKLLLSKGADPLNENQDGTDPMSHAITSFAYYNGNFILYKTTIDLLMDNIETDEITPYAYKLGELAIEIGSIYFLEKLSERMDLKNIVDENGNTLLHKVAAEYEEKKLNDGSKNIVEKLLFIGVNTRNNLGQTPLDLSKGAVKKIMDQYEIRHQVQ